MFIDFFSFFSKSSVDSQTDSPKCKLCGHEVGLMTCQLDSNTYLHLNLRKGGGGGGIVAE